MRVIAVFVSIVAIASGLVEVSATLTDNARPWSSRSFGRIGTVVRPDQDAQFHGRIGTVIPNIHQGREVTSQLVSNVESLRPFIGTTVRYPREPSPEPLAFYSPAEMQYLLSHGVITTSGGKRALAFLDDEF